MKKKIGNFGDLILCGTDLIMFPHNYMVDIVVNKLVDLFYKFFLILCHDGQQRLVKFHV